MPEYNPFYGLNPPENYDISTNPSYPSGNRGGGGGGGYNWMMDPNAPWNQLMDTSGLGKIREMQLQQLQQQMGQLGKGLERKVGQAWWGTGAPQAGVKSSIPGQRYARQYGDLTSRFYQPAFSQIQQDYQTGVMGQRQTGLDWLRQAQMFKAAQEAQKGGGFWDFLKDAFGAVGTTAGYLAGKG